MLVSNGLYYGELGFRSLPNGMIYPKIRFAGNNRYHIVRKNCDLYITGTVSDKMHIEKTYSLKRACIFNVLKKIEI